MRTLLLAALLAGAAAPAFAAGQLTVRNATAAEPQSQPEPSAPPQRPQRSVERRSESFGGSGPGNSDFGTGRREMGVGRQNAYGGGSPAGVKGPAVELPADRVIPAEVARERPQHNFQPKWVQAPGHESRAMESGERRSGGHGLRVRSAESAGSPITIEQRNSESGRSPITIEDHIVRSAPKSPITVRNAGGDLVEQKHPVPRVFEGAERRVSRTPMLGTEPPAPRTASSLQARPSHAWHSDWRNDRRYDWRDWRRRHHSHFRLGFYYDPFGWDYFRYGIGWRLWPSYYSSRFWLHDPWYYRLPSAYGPYRWVRYFDDAVLVNIYTGEVVDIVYNFFW